MKINRLLKEIIIIVSVFVVLCALVSLFMSSLFGNAALDINMHDTYDIAGSIWTISVLPAFFWLITIGYLVRASIYKFKEQSQNIILFISCTCLNILMLHYFELEAKMAGFIHSMARSETLYPPLSALGNHLQEAKPGLYPDQVQILFFVQIILMLLLVIIAALTAKNWKPIKNAL